MVWAKVCQSWGRAPAEQRPTSTKWWVGWRTFSLEPVASCRFASDLLFIQAQPLSPEPEHQSSDPLAPAAVRQAFLQSGSPCLAQRLRPFLGEASPWCFLSSCLRVPCGLRQPYVSVGTAFSVSTCWKNRRHSSSPALLRRQSRDVIQQNTPFLSSKFENVDRISSWGSTVPTTASKARRALRKGSLWMHGSSRIFQSFSSCLSHPIELCNHSLERAFSLRSFLLQKGRQRHSGRRGLRKVTSQAAAEQFSGPRVFFHLHTSPPQEPRSHFQ